MLIALLKNGLLSIFLFFMLLISVPLFIMFSPSQEAFYPEQVQDLCGLDISESTVVSSEDSHGGFLGDGSLTVVFDCAQISDSVAEQTAKWETLPLTENLQRIMYDSEGFNLAEEHNIPEITNGCYFFLDRHSEATDPTSDANLFDRASYNFSLIIYDSDNYKLYLFEFDT